MGLKGISIIMENHKCSQICKAIGLPAYGGSWFSIFKLQEGRQGRKL